MVSVRWGLDGSRVQLPDVGGTLSIPMSGGLIITCMFTCELVRYVHETR